MVFGTQSDLIARIRTAANDVESRPIALLTGAGVSTPSVPNVNSIIRLVRNGLDADEQREFDGVLSQHAIPSDKYQAAFQFLSFRRPPDFRDRVVRLATLGAFASESPMDNSSLNKVAEYESQVDRWNLPPGLAALGRIWTGLPSTLRGPILTTNFDPLTEIAIRRAGGNATTHIHSDDSSFLMNTRVQVGTSVVHLHGFWRESNTLNTPAQLVRDRPALGASLRVVLQQHTLIVVGYGGWSDVISKQILELVREQSSNDLDILWCMFEEDDSLAQALATSSTLSDLHNNAGNVFFYSGIDSNEFFPALERVLSDKLEYSQNFRLTSAGNLVGWTAIERDFLAAHAEQSSPESANTFFDGRLPSWHDAVNPRVPRRDISNQLSNSLKEALARRESTLHLLVGPSGEGKSTAAMQVAASVSKMDVKCRVLFHDSDYFGTETEILDLPDDRQYVLVLDEGHKFVDRLRALTESIRKSGRKGIHILVISRDSDWRASGGATVLWSRQLPTIALRLSGISRPDAVAIIAAWEIMGDRALGALRDLNGTDERVDALLGAALDYRLNQGGSLLGALLLTRYGDGLTDHVRQLVERLRDRHVPNAQGREVSLFDAIIRIALPHANGVLDLNLEVLSLALDLTEPELHAYVLAPLAEEAAISFGSGRVLVRHSSIAIAICDVAAEIGYDLEPAVRDIVRAAAGVIESAGYERGIGQLAYLSSNLERHRALQVAAAQAAVEAVPNRLSYRTSLSAAYRRANQHSMASEVNSAALSVLLHATDSYGARGYFTEWGVAEGNRDNWANNAALVGMSLQDSPGLDRMTLDRAGHSLSCLMLALRKLYGASGTSTYAEGLAAALAIYSAIDTHKDPAWVNDARSTVRQAGLQIPSIDDASTIEAFLMAACITALGNSEEALPASIPPSRFEFTELVHIAQQNAESWTFDRS